MDSGSPTFVTRVEPVLAEVLNSWPLFGSFLKFMSSDMAHENVLFLKEVQLFKHIRRPIQELHREACRIFFTFICEGAPIAVNVGSDTKQNIMHTLFSATTQITSHLFDDACFEIRNLIMPKFREWIALKEWVAKSFDKLPPPTFEEVIRSPQLTHSFCEYIKAKKTSDSLIFEQFKTTDGIAEEHPPAENIDDIDLSIRSRDEVCNLVLFCSAVSKLVDSADKKASIGDEDARHIWNQFRKKVPIKHVKGARYGAFVLHWLKGLISEFSDSAIFGDWIDRRSWVSEATHEFKPSQTLDENGYQVFPTLAYIVSNKSMTAFLLYLFGECEITKCVRFLLDVYKFVDKYSKALVTDDSESVKQMGSDAKTLYYSYIESDGSSDNNITVSNTENGESTEVVGESSPMKISRRHSVVGPKCGIPVERKLKSELKTLLFSRLKSRITYDMFTRCAAYIYRHCENTWFRDFQHSYIWSCMDYDNNSIAARAIEALCDSSIVRDVQEPYPPFMDDILVNKELQSDYLHFAFKIESEHATLEAFLDESDAACQNIPPEKLVLESRRLLDMIALIELDSFAATSARFVCDNVMKCKNLNPMVLRYIRSLVFESALSISYPRWVKNGEYRQKDWTRVSDKTWSETSFLTSLLESLLDSSPSLVECSNKYNRVLIPGQPVLLQKSKSQFRLVDSGSSTLSPSPHTSSPTNVAFADPPVYPHGEASSANSSSSGSVNTTISSETPLVTPEPVPQDMPPLTLSAMKRGKNPLAACQEVITTPHPRVSDIVSYLPRVPTLDETMDSVMLRKMFEDYYLLPRLVDDTERELWKDLRDYAAAFARLSDEDVTTNQPELRAKAQKILDTYPSYLPKQPFLKSRIASECFVTIRFFREEEKYLYGQAHQSYESLLERSGWLRP